MAEPHGESHAGRRPFAPARRVVVSVLQKSENGIMGRAYGSPLTQWHVNTPLVWVSLFLTPMIYNEGGRMRWGAMWAGMIIGVSGIVSAEMDNALGDIRNSSKLGMLAGAGFAITPRLDIFPIQRFIPNKVSSAVGASYFSYHAYKYMFDESTQSHFARGEE
jgi:hypothetical protein